MEKVKILEPFEYIRNETPEAPKASESESESENERWTEQIDGVGMYIGGGLGTLMLVGTILWGIVTTL